MPTVIIPMAGQGRRFADAGFREPKPLIPVLGQRTMIEMVLDRISRAGVRARVLLVGRMERGRPALLPRPLPNLDVEVVALEDDSPTSGAADTVLRGLRQLGATSLPEPVAVMDCDALFLGDTLRRALQGPCVVYYDDGVQCAGADATPPRSPFSHIELDSDGMVSRIREKERISPLVSTGLVVFPDLRTLLEGCERVVGGFGHGKGQGMAAETYISCVVDDVLRRSGSRAFAGVRIPPADMICLGTPEHLRAFRESACAFLFDLDGTLVDSDPLYREAWALLLAECAGLGPEEAARVFDEHIAGHSDASVHTRLAGAYALPAIAELSARKDALFVGVAEARGVVPVPGAVELLRELTEATPHATAVVTNANRAAAEYLLRRLGIRPDLLVIGSECARPKPFPDPYLCCLRALGVPRCRTAVFEDSRSGILSALGVFPGRTFQIVPAGGSVHSVSVHPLRDFLGTTAAGLVEALCARPEGSARDELARVHSALDRHFGGRELVVVHPAKVKGGYIADVVFVDAGAAELAFKYKNVDSTSRLADMAEQLKLYDREYQFYERLRDEVCAATRLRAPACHGVVRDGSPLSPLGVLLERVRGETMQQPTLEVCLRVVDRLAEMHAHFRGCLERHPFLRRATDPLFRPLWPQLVEQRWPEFRRRWACVLSEADLARGDTLARDFSETQRAIGEAADTLIHGDAKMGNLLFDASGEPHFLDWQYIAYGLGEQDVAFFIIESLDERQIREWAPAVLQRYAEAVRSRAGITSRLVLSAGYFPFFVALWFGTLDASELVDVTFPERFVRRLFAFLRLCEGGWLLSASA